MLTYQKILMQGRTVFPDSGLVFILMKKTILPYRKHHNKKGKEYGVFVQGEASNAPRLMTANFPAQKEEGDISVEKQRAQADGRFDNLAMKELEM